MGEGESKSVFGGFSIEAAPPEPAQADSTMEFSEEKSVIPASPDEKPDEAKVLVVVESMSSTKMLTAPPSTERSSGGSSDRYAVLARVETEKRLSIIKAWEDTEKVKAENKTVKKMHSITAWENTKKAIVEAELRKKEGQVPLFKTVQEKEINLSLRTKRATYLPRSLNDNIKENLDKKKPSIN